MNQFYWRICDSWWRWQKPSSQMNSVTVNHFWQWRDTPERDDVADHRELNIVHLDFVDVVAKISEINISNPGIIKSKSSAWLRILFMVNEKINLWTNSSRRCKASFNVFSNAMQSNTFIGKETNGTGRRRLIRQPALRHYQNMKLTFMLALCWVWWGRLGPPWYASHQNITILVCHSCSLRRSVSLACWWAHNLPLSSCFLFPFTLPVLSVGNGPEILGESVLSAAHKHTFRLPK